MTTIQILIALFLLSNAISLWWIFTHRKLKTGSGIFIPPPGVKHIRVRAQGGGGGGSGKTGPGGSIEFETE